MEHFPEVGCDSSNTHAENHTRVRICDTKETIVLKALMSEATNDHLLSHLFTFVFT